jgi:hypothetical protein
MKASLLLLLFAVIFAESCTTARRLEDRPRRLYFIKMTGVILEDYEPRYDMAKRLTIVDSREKRSLAGYWIRYDYQTFIEVTQAAHNALSDVRQK